MLRSFLFLFIFLISTFTFSQNKSSKDKPDNWDSFIKNWMQKDSVPGIFLTIAKEGKVLKQKGYGYTNIELKSIPQSNTVYEIATITKMFTGIAINILAEQGQLHLDSSILTYIDSLPQGWKLVTVRNLLYHCHGLNPMHYDESMLHGPPGYRYTTRDQLLFFKGQRQYALAGTASYNTNSAYFLLGLIIQHVGGTGFNDFIRRYIFDKAGMKNSSFINEEANSTNRAQGYTIRSGKWINWMLKQDIESLDCNSFAGILTTADDMLLFDSALRNNLLVKEETYQQILEPFILPDGNPAASGRNSWGMGCMVRDILGYQCVFQLGQTGTGFFRFPKENLSVIIFTNLGEGNDFIKDKGTDIGDYGYKLAEETVRNYLLKK